jgi:hypothetical protein
MKRLALLFGLLITALPVIAQSASERVIYPSSRISQDRDEAEYDRPGVVTHGSADYYEKVYEVTPAYPDEVNQAEAQGQWWSERTGAWIGSIAGSILGLLGALIGTLSSAGKARSFVLGIMRFIFVVGVVVLVAGIVAVIDSQPYGVWYPLILLGLLMTVVMGGLAKITKRRYEELEMRKMKAQDLA